MRVRLLVLLLTGFGPFALGQNHVPPSIFPQTPTQPPASLPDGCSASLIANLGIVQGTDSYLFMRREIEALRLGHEASQELQAALKGSSDTTGNSAIEMHQLVQLITGLTDAQNTYLCGSFLLGALPAKDDEHEVAKKMLISVLNRMALNTWMLDEQMQKIATDLQTSKANPTVETAEVISSLLENRKAAGTDLIDAAVMSGLLTIYTGDPNAKTTEYVAVSCSERDTLLGKLSPLSKEVAVDEFTRSAGLLFEFFQGHKCRT